MAHARLERVDGRRDPEERVAHLVGDPGDERAHRRHLLAAAQRRLEQRHLARRLVALPAQLDDPASEADRDRDARDHEARARERHAPALGDGDEAERAQRDGEDAREEDREPAEQVHRGPVAAAGDDRGGADQAHHERERGDRRGLLGEADAQDAERERDDRRQHRELQQAVDARGALAGRQEVAAAQAAEQERGRQHRRGERGAERPEPGPQVLAPAPLEADHGEPEAEQVDREVEAGAIAHRGEEDQVVERGREQQAVEEAPQELRALVLREEGLGAHERAAHRLRGARLEREERGPLGVEVVGQREEHAVVAQRPRGLRLVEADAAHGLPARDERQPGAGALEVRDRQEQQPVARARAAQVDAEAQPVAPAAGRRDLRSVRGRHEARASRGSRHVRERQRPRFVLEQRQPLLDRDAERVRPRCEGLPRLAGGARRVGDGEGQKEAHARQHAGPRVARLQRWRSRMPDSAMSRR